MATRRTSTALSKQKFQTGGGRILALVPAENAPSDDSEYSDLDDELRVHSPLSMSTSSAPSVDSSLERLNILDDDEEPATSQNVRLTLIFQSVYSIPSLEPNCKKVPMLSDIPSLPATPTTPATRPTPAPSAPPVPTASGFMTPGLAAARMRATASSNSRPRNTRSQRPTFSVTKRPRRMTKFTLSYQWKKAVFRHRATIKEDSEHTDILDQTSLGYFYKFFRPLKVDVGYAPS